MWREFLDGSPAARPRYLGKIAGGLGELERLVDASSLVATLALASRSHEAEKRGLHMLSNG